MSTATQSNPTTAPPSAIVQAKRVLKSSDPDKTVTTQQALEILQKAGVSPTATSYHPIYLDRVYVVGPSPSEPFQQVNPMYCLSKPSALCLMSILQTDQPVAYLADPTAFSTGSPFHYTEEVPWYTFDNGAVRNAGTLAYYWNANSGDPGGNTALKNAQLDIAWG